MQRRVAKNETKTTIYENIRHFPQNQPEMRSLWASPEPGTSWRSFEILWACLNHHHRVFELMVPRCWDSWSSFGSGWSCCCADPPPNLLVYFYYRFFPRNCPKKQKSRRNREKQWFLVYIFRTERQCVVFLVRTGGNAGGFVRCRLYTVISRIVVVRVVQR